MTSGFLATLTVIGLLVVVVLAVIARYNALVRRRNQVDNAWSQIDVQLKRRRDLIPNLVERAQGYLRHERGTLEALTQARAQAREARSVPEAARAEGALGQALLKFQAVAENCPDLKANQNFLALQEELAGAENRIAFARQAYNDAVLFYHNQMQMFPSNVIAGSFRFEKRAFFELPSAAEREAPQVKFS
jgi:LemA protein